MSILSIFQRKTSSRNYIPEIDGLRFFAIAWVVLFHFFDAFCSIFHQTSPQLPKLFAVLGGGGYKGVHLFFCISGLILAIPFVGKSRTNIDIGHYYKRRFVRIEPPYIIALSLGLLWCLCSLKMPLQNALPHYLASAFYVHNIVYAQHSTINIVAWTLEIEIQFYLLAPLFFQIFRLKKTSRRWIIAGCTIGLLILQHFYYPTILSLYQFAPYFFAGMLVADWYVAGWPKLIVSKYFPIIGLPALYAIVWAPVNTRHDTAIILIAATVVMYALALSFRPLKKLLSIPVISTIGGMCYSIYLLHRYIQISSLTLLKENHIGGSSSLQIMLLFSVTTFAVLIICAGYYLCVERPFMKLSARISSKSKSL